MKCNVYLHCGEVNLQKAGCVEDFVAILLSNGYSVTLTEKNNKINIKISKENKQ